MSFTIKTPQVGDQFQIGDTSIYVIEVEEDTYSRGDYGSYGEGRTRVTGHDNDGNEVEVSFYPYNEDEDY